MKKKFFVIFGIVFLTSTIFLIYLLLSYFRPPNFLLPIVGEDHKIKLIRELSAKNLQLDTPPDESPDTLTVQLLGTLVYFSKEKDISVQVAALQMILGKTTIDGGIPKVIDLRFNKPILKY